MAMARTDPITNRVMLGDVETRRANSLLAQFFKWAHATEGVSAADRRRDLVTIKQALSFLEFNVAKTDAVARMEAAEAAAFTALFKDIETQIEQARLDIGVEQAKLQEEKRVQKNKQEYDALAAIIQKHPSRQETIAETERVQADLEALTNQRAELDAKLGLRKKQFHLLVHAAHALRDTLEGEERAQKAAEEARAAAAEAEAAGAMDASADGAAPDSTKPATATATATATASSDQMET